MLRKPAPGGGRVTRTSFFYKGKKRRESEKEAGKLPAPSPPAERTGERLILSTHAGTSFNPRFLMLSFFALTKSNSFPYSSLREDAPCYQTARPTQGWTTHCSDTHGQGPVGPGAPDHIIQPNSSETPQRTAVRKRQTLVLKVLEHTSLHSLKSSGEKKAGRGVYLFTRHARSWGYVRRGDVITFLLVCISYFTGWL